MDVPEPDAFLRAMARRYVWDQTEAKALADPARIIRRVMDFGVLEDALALEPRLGRARLVDVLRAARRRDAPAFLVVLALSPRPRRRRARPAADARAEVCVTTRYDLLPHAQRLILPALAPLRTLGFVLYGGTAIALRLGHRASVDFDFFTDRPMDRAAMIAAAPFLAETETLQDEPDAWTIQTRCHEAAPVKLSFFAGLGFGRVGMPVPDDEGHLLLASLDDLLGHKLKVLQRVEAKDYRDIAALLGNGLTLERGLGAARALFPNFPPCEAVKALVYFGDGDLASLSAEERATLVGHVERFTTPEAMTILSGSLGA